jgi:hypothetical protein
MEGVLLHIEEVSVIFLKQSHYYIILNLQTLAVVISPGSLLASKYSTLLSTCRSLWGSFLLRA